MPVFLLPLLAIWPIFGYNLVNFGPCIFVAFWLPFSRFLVVIWWIPAPVFLLLLLAIWLIFGYNLVNFGPVFALLLLAIWPMFGYNLANFGSCIFVTFACHLADFWLLFSHLVATHFSFVAIFRRHFRCSILANRVCNLVVFVVVKLASYISLVS